MTYKEFENLFNNYLKKYPQAEKLLVDASALKPENDKSNFNYSYSFTKILKNVVMEILGIKEPLLEFAKRFKKDNPEKTFIAVRKSGECEEGKMIVQSFTDDVAPTYEEGMWIPKNDSTELHLVNELDLNGYKEDYSDTLVDLRTI